MGRTEKASFGQDLQDYARPIGTSTVWLGSPGPTGQTGPWHWSDRSAQAGGRTSHEAGLQAKTEGGGAENGS